MHEYSDPELEMLSEAACLQQYLLGGMPIQIGYTLWSLQEDERPGTPLKL